MASNNKEDQLSKNKSAYKVLSPITILLASLFFSGVAGIINQVIWQRALKLYFGGSETISSMMVVLVFMLGLGLGSLYMGFRVQKFKNPLKIFMYVELLLFVANISICLLLTLDLSESIYAFQRWAVSLGVPLRFLYAIGSIVILLFPCFLMGTTMPIASEVCQRQLKVNSSQFVTVLFFLNTIGAVLGAFLSGLWFLPYLGQKLSLIVAALFNCLAGALAFGLFYFRFSGSFQPKVTSEAGIWTGRFKPEEIMGFFLGFLALGYEMYLFRTMILVYKPYPHIFGLTLCLYLLLWSIGVFAAGKIRECIRTQLVICAIILAIIPLLYIYHRFSIRPRTTISYLITILYFVPCFSFGILFGQVVSRFIKEWGNDVGRYYGLNTFGSCLGIIIVTLVGYELNHSYNVWLFATGFILLLLYFIKFSNFQKGLSPRGLFLVKPGMLALALILCGQIYLGTKQPVVSSKVTSYYGRDGVVEITHSGALIWDGLWHSALSKNNDHIGSNNWYLGVIPALCHKGKIEDALIIGLGTGVTAHTISMLDSVKKIDVYDINHTLKKILNHYPEGTLNILKNPKMNLIWQDGRSGMALNSKKYDLITQQPLYLSQAGSSILLSREYMQLVSSRLKKGGVFCIYCNSMGNARQSLVVRKTAQSVFPYYKSFMNSYLLVVSNSPIEYTEDSIRKRLEKNDPFAREVFRYGLLKTLSKLDSPSPNWKDCKYSITDDHPIVEYLQFLPIRVR